MRPSMLGTWDAQNAPGGEKVNNCNENGIEISWQMHFCVAMPNFQPSTTWVVKANRTDSGLTLTDLSQIYAVKWQRVHRASSSIIWNMSESEIVWVLQLQYYNVATVNYGTWHRHICLKTLHHPSIYSLVSMSIGKFSIQSPSLSSGRGGESLPCMPWGWKQPHILMEALYSDLPDIGDLTHTEWDASLMIRILISSTFILKKYFPNLSHLLAWPCRRYQATIHSNCLKVQEGLTHCRNFHQQFIDEKYRTAMKYNLLTERGLTIERTGHRGVC